MATIQLRNWINTNIFDVSSSLSHYKWCFLFCKLKENPRNKSQSNWRANFILFSLKFFSSALHSSRDSTRLFSLRPSFSKELEQAIDGIPATTIIGEKWKVRLTLFLVDLLSPPLCSQIIRLRNDQRSSSVDCHTHGWFSRSTPSSDCSRARWCECYPWFLACADLNRLPS